MIESQEPLDWFKIGDNELGFAITAIDYPDAYYPHVCFLCQQAVEKYLKGFLILNKKSFPKIHDLTELVKMCGKIDKSFLKLLKNADLLSQYYLVVRYPIEFREAGKKEAAGAIKSAERIIKFIKIRN